MMELVSISNRTRAKVPRLPFSVLKNDILGKKYSLSIAFISEKESRELNRAYRGKDNPTNILSFPLKKTEGELLLCPGVMRREAKEKKFDRDYEVLVGFLVIHGMLHLKGRRHSSRMEQEESKYDKKYFGRNRRRLARNPSGSGRIRKRRKTS